MRTTSVMGGAFPLSLRTGTEGVRVGNSMVGEISEDGGGSLGRHIFQLLLDPFRLWFRRNQVVM